MKYLKHGLAESNSFLEAALQQINFNKADDLKKIQERILKNIWIP